MAKYSGGNGQGMTKEFKTELRKQINLLRGEQGDIVINLNEVALGKHELVDTSEVEMSTSEETKQEMIRTYGLISAADNESNSREQYTGRKNYKTLYNNKQADMWYDVPFFGRMDKYGLISGIDLDAKLDLTNEAGTDMIVFVFEAFNRFAQEYNARANNPICCRGLSKNSMIPSLSVVKSYVNEFEIQDAHLEKLYSDFFTDILFDLRNSNKIKNIDNFYTFLKEYIEDKKLPLTTPGFMESEMGSAYIGGLIIDVLPAAADNDIQKVEFLSDPNYEIYANLARKHGFKIDINVPWRIIFDYRTLQFSKAIKQWPNFRQKYHDNLVPQASYVSFSSRYNGFTQTLLNFYNRFISSYPTYNSVNVVSNSSSLKRSFQKSLSGGCSAIGGHATTVTPERRKIFRKQEKLDQHGVEGTLKVVPIKYFNWYAEIRNIERQKPLNSQLLKILKKQSGQIYLSALNVFKTDISGPGIFQVFIKNSNIAIHYVEYVLGTVASRYHGKSLTLQEKDPIMVYGKIREVMRIPQKVKPTEGPGTSAAESVLKKQEVSMTFQGQSFSY